MIGTTLQRLLDEKNSNVNELSRQINVSAQTLYSIIKRDNMKVDFEVLLKICEALSVPVEIFYNDYVDFRYKKKSPTSTEWAHIQKYRTLDKHGIDVVDYILDAEYTRCVEIKEANDDGYKQAEEIAQTLNPILQDSENKDVG